MTNISLLRPVTGGVRIPFAAVCRVNGEPFSGTVTVEWTRLRDVPEYGNIAETVRTCSLIETTCEELAVDVREALRWPFPEGIVVRVDVTNESHYPAWAEAE